ncbi:MAG: hypothetical protein A2W61_01895 [Deltaproteobacteria bacterium RIFCSPLOWO2_01_44_7]|nr:MAG: hypothetical protein A2712_06425 [Deltaproteobacteria bacterium RIFCSPHIGHO2_01_FULL_43_49]OGQ15983.1 MAG: hypothetical protein A3D22_06245 [Deltaproteobacteria bacterium RIFCSPHIGHO2_02_FULL_44_53]OGQ28940.1 MAG: hypothetical protein A3D98_03830 [Deltaproteobacteria bacterium RIFCSPHIGHO2_12_FULL_44_21]OGQ33189.1 MAG: hypothetical protein A2979_04195 [Deltaproteobacteria bacterium RIFCSPLOWO2_01_FULL_45_74]OGQ42285.1 MAG: hypothetical protein A3I70_06500 [Deltaproteobacteria bacterium 
MEQAKQARYIVYARKSSESEDRQIQSIEDQINRLKQLAKDLNLNVVTTMIEAKSAKKPYNRPVFAEMLQKIENGEASGILCWQLNRLSRNPVDSGQLGWLLQQGIIQSIQTIEREYLPDDNVILFSVESGMANQYIIELRKNTKRGVLSKFEKGWYPYLAPVGFLNDKEKKTIIKDHERFDLVRKMWDMMLSGCYSPPQILDKAVNEWGLRTVKLKKLGGTKLSRSAVYHMFTNPFYAGIITHDGKEYEGKHESMITLEEFNRVQFLLGRKGKPRPKKHAFAFTGLIRCGECGCLFTAENKKKLIKGTGEVREYTYYHCTRKKKEIDCSQRKVIREDALEQQIAEEIQKFTILPEFRDWALEVLREQNEKEIGDREKIYESQHRAVVEAQKKLDRLLEMRLNDLLTDEQFKEKRNQLETEINHLKRNLRETEGRAEHWVEIAENAFNFATHARDAFLNGDLITRKQILMALGSNPIIKDGKFTIQANEWLVPITNDYPNLEKEYQRLEPTQLPDNKEKTEALASVRSSWLRGLDSNQRPSGYDLT